jgi:glycogen debranching enzyme
VYSQACWILALKSLSNLLLKLGDQHKASNIQAMANNAIFAVEQTLWSDDDQCYIDLLDADLHLDENMHNRLITRDISLHLVALIEGDKEKPSKRIRRFSKKETQIYDSFIESESDNRALCTPATLKRIIWKNEIPLVTEIEIIKTRPWVLKANEYHNHTLWAWITSIEMISAHRYGKLADFNCLFSRFESPNKLQLNKLHQWVDPITFDGKGAFPFRTGISSIRLVVLDYMRRKGIQLSIK